MRTIAPIAALAIACASCNAPSDDIRPEPSVVENTQGLSPSPQRVRTADTDRDQLRAFTLPVPADTPNEVVEVVEGPFVITGVVGSYPYLLINFDGICPAYEDIVGGSEDFTLNNLGVGVAPGSVVTVLVPEGAVLCGLRQSLPFATTWMIQGYVPY